MTRLFVTLAALATLALGQRSSAQSTDLDKVLEIRRSIALTDSMFRVDVPATLGLYERAYTLSSELVRNKLPAKRWRGEWALLAESSNGRGYVLQYLGRMDSAYRYHRECLRISNEVGLDTLKAYALNNIGLAFFRQGILDSAVAYYLKSYEFRMAKGWKALAMAPLNNIAWIHQSRGQLDSALHYLMQVLEINLATKDTAFLSNTYHSIGVNHYKRGDYAMAIRYHDRALRLREITDDLPGISASSNELSLIYSNLGDNSSAMQYLRRALNLTRARGGDRMGMATQLNNLGALYKETGELDSAWQVFREGYAIAEDAGDQFNMTLILSNMGAVAKLQGRPAEARELWHKCVDLCRTIGNMGQLAATLQLLAEDQMEQGQLGLAEKTFLEAIAHAEQAEQELTMATSYKKLAEVYHRQGAEGKAYQMLQKYWASWNKLHNAEADRAMIRQQVEYARSVQDKSDSLMRQGRMNELAHDRTVATLKMKQAEQRSWVLGLGALALATGGGVAYRLDHKRRRAKHERDAMQLELKALRVQMNPHFLYNALSSINNYVLENERGLASSYLTKFAKLTRLVLENNREPLVTLARDLEALLLYTELERLRLNGKFDLQVEIAPSIDPERTMVPPMIIQPFVENAIWHGLAKKEGKGLLCLHISKRESNLLVSVEDDGVGREHSAHARQERAALGTRITQERLDLLSTSNGHRASIRYSDMNPGTGHGTGTRVELEIPFTAG